MCLGCVEGRCLCYDMSIRSEANFQASFISLHYVNRGDRGQNSTCHSGIVAACFTHLAILPPLRAFEVLGGRVHLLMWIDLDTKSLCSRVVLPSGHLLNCASTPTRLGNNIWLTPCVNKYLGTQEPLREQITIAFSARFCKWHFMPC